MKADSIWEVAEKAQQDCGEGWGQGREKMREGGREGREGMAEQGDTGAV
jgi:hypothetical protein